MNNCIFTGAVKKLTCNDKVGKFAITIANGKDDNGETKFSWINFVCFKKVLEYVTKTVHEGDKVAIRAAYSTNEYQGKTYPQFIVESIEVLGKAKSEAEDPGLSFDNLMEGEIPFN